METKEKVLIIGADYKTIFESRIQSVKISRYKDKSSFKLEMSLVISSSVKFAKTRSAGEG